MNIFKICEEQAIEYFKAHELDISTKALREALPAQTKQEIFNFLAGRFMFYQLNGAV